MGIFRWGIFGTGAISARFVAGLRAASGMEAAFVASRDIGRAQTFAAGAGIPRAIEGYEAAAEAGGVDAIYVATPPSEHARHALLAIKANVPVLIEKPFASTEADARAIAEAARGRGVFAMEAMWTRFLPAALALRDRIAAGAIGEGRMITGQFGLSDAPDPANTLLDPAMGGGALAHLGAYPLSLAQWLFGTPELLSANGTIGSQGTEEDATFQLRYPGGTTGSFAISLRCWMPERFDIGGTHGAIGFDEALIRPSALRLHSLPPRQPATAEFGAKARVRESGLNHRIRQILRRGQPARIAAPYAGNGYHYEAEAVRACLTQGKTQSDIMPLDDSIAAARTIDAIRSAIRTSSNP